MSDWYARGSYYEACNCEAICPCRPQGDRPGGRSTYGVCDFVTSWFIREGGVDDVEVSRRAVVLAGSYDDEEPGKPWRVVLYLDERCSPEQHAALEDVWLRRLHIAGAIAEVLAVRSARIDLDHAPDARSIQVDPYVTVRTRERVDHTEIVSCAIPGHDNPGREIIADVMRVADPLHRREVRGRCGFATTFDYPV